MGLAARRGKAVIGIAISEKFAAAGVRLSLGVVTACVNAGDGDAALHDALEATAASRLAALEDEPPAQVPAVAAARQAYKALGKDPARYRPAAEALLRRVKQGKGVPRVNAIVDINNLLSLETGISIGAYDVDKIAPPIVARPGEDGDSYEGIGRGPLNLAGLPLLADASGPFGCPTSDSERSAVTSDTHRLAMVLFAFGEHAPGEASDAVRRAVVLLERHAGARDVETALLGPGTGPDTAG